MSRRPVTGSFILAAAAALVAARSEVAHAQAGGWQAPAGSQYSSTPSYSPAANPAPAYSAANSAPPTTPTPGEPYSATAEPLAPAVDNTITHAQVTSGTGQLPTDHGQVWREYDITPYTMRERSNDHPEQAIVDWILRETGYEAWHSTPVSLLSADRKTLRVYHTPQMQNTVAGIVDRFVSTRAANHGFGLRIITLKNPNWRTRALGLMTPIPVQSPGVQGWIMARENAAVLLADLRKRSDYRDQQTPQDMILNGQTKIISTMAPRAYVKSVVAVPNVWPGYQNETAQIDEGFTLEFSPLLSADAVTTDAVVKLRLSQIEKMLKVPLDVPSPMAQNQRMEIEVPQLTMVELHERFRWPTDQVLLLSMGVVAEPGPERPNIIMDNLPIPKMAPRADALLMVEHTGTVSQLAAPATATPGGATSTVPQTATVEERTFHGRY